MLGPVPAGQRPAHPTGGGHNFDLGILIVAACVVGLVLVVTVISGGGNTNSSLPDDQQRFLQAVEKGRQATQGENEIRVAQARKQRATDTCEVLPTSLRVEGWVGTIEEISTTLGGDGGVLSVALTENVAVTTSNNGLSDIGSKTLIDEDSALYATLSRMEPGTRVEFTGQFIAGEGCIDELSVMDENGMATPDFLFRFRSLKAR